LIIDKLVVNALVPFQHLAMVAASRKQKGLTLSLQWRPVSPDFNPALSVANPTSPGREERMQQRMRGAGYGSCFFPTLVSVVCANSYEIGAMK
jgi:hypothetical protein